MTYKEYKRRRQEDPDFGVIKIRYDRIAFANITNRVKQSYIYTTEEKNTLFQMIQQMEHEDWLLYMAEIYQENQFDFHIPNFEKHKKNLVSEVYNELTAQLLDNYRDYEEIFYADIKEWFDGLTINLDFIILLDKKFSEMGVKVHY